MSFGSQSHSLPGLRYSYEKKNKRLRKTRAGLHALRKGTRPEKAGPHHNSYVT